MRKRISDIRRQELAEATLLTLQEHGFQGTTVQRVSERAGMSHGLVHHYFKTKADMLEAAVRLTNARITVEVIRLLRAAETPRERIAAVVEGNYAMSVYSREVAQAWASCAGEAAFNERFARIIRMIQKRLVSNLLFDLRKLLPAEDAVLAANGIAMMIDGGWLKSALATDHLDRETAMAPIWHYIDGLLAAKGKKAVRPQRRR
ncbi:MAG: transcriptional regulator [Alphaproteobacteria bacterium]|nr:MAG: transcriptional regulator [Alphaproteobacteria bacterium]